MRIFPLTKTSKHTGVETERFPKLEFRETTE